MTLGDGAGAGTEMERGRVGLGVVGGDVGEVGGLRCRLDVWSDALLELAGTTGGGRGGVRSVGALAVRLCGGLASTVWASTGVAWENSGPLNIGRWAGVSWDRIGWV